MASTTTTPPQDYHMDALPSELLSTWMWKQHTKHLLTPPMTSTFEQRRMHLPSVKVTTTLPPITHLQRQLPPLTPPDEDASSSSSSGSSSKLPPIHDFAVDEQQSKPFMPADAPYLVDWLDVSRTRSAHFVAEKTCEMICYLWFSSQPPPSSPSHPTLSPNPSRSPTYRPRSTTTTLQLVATPTFIQFMQKLLETTQVSQSVIVLSLHYIYRLKERNRFTAGQAGSEFRIAVAALMMANKFLDDNTYTNKTWSEVSGIDLCEINKMEREFLLGVDFNLYVDKCTYESWLNLLKGLVMAKERDCRQWRKSRGLLRISRLAQPPSAGPPTRTYSRHRMPSHRARSTSPGQTTRSLAYPSNGHQHSAAPQRYHAPSAAPDPHLSSPTPRPTGSKRTAEAAFSPTSATFSHLPSKRPVSISLRIPEHPATSTPSHSPLEGLQSFAKMSIASSSPSVNRPTPAASTWHHSSPATLSTAYQLDEERRSSVPQNLYFYTLSCSPMENDEESRWRKARLRYHQPAVPSQPAYYYPPQPSRPIDIQSASASPHDMHDGPPSLPHFNETMWTRRPSANSGAGAAAAAAAPPPQVPAAPVYRHESAARCEPGYAPRQYASQQEYAESPVQSAPFANAGPPGVHSYPTPLQHRSSPVYAHQSWARGRRY